MCQAGFSGEEAPRCVFLFIVFLSQPIDTLSRFCHRSTSRCPTEHTRRWNRRPICWVCAAFPSCLNGLVISREKAQVKRGIPRLLYPLDRGWVRDWDDMETLVAPYIRDRASCRPH
ncbi:hypothetical protein DFH07DRAFT_858198 [Mycena maculata]|uniref:Uncharacterized protein n=1 Tax=Mycena maculata TaxID=230809 RepID=A0AAD7HHM1_9AGAR|nr:hypothetical protein DFH07DRAFT_858198 [Mycena maculata]